jgi:RND family efflux transporter MFP subunit
MGTSECSIRPSIFPLSPRSFVVHLPSIMKAELLVTLGTALLFTACHRSETARQPTETPAAIHGRLIEIQEQELSIDEQLVGTVQPELQATVSSKVTGRILEMHAVPGQIVKQGDLLARIETPELQTALARAEAALANAASEAARFEKLKDSGSVSQREIERVQTTLKVATAERDQVRSQLDDADITAPFGGRITRKELDTGDLVQPGTPVCQIEDPSRLRFEMHAAENLASHLNLGDAFKVKVDASNLELVGTVAEISPSADPGSRTFLVKLDLPDEGELFAGQFGRAFVPRGTRSTLVIPVSAVLTRGQLHLSVVVDSQGIGHLRIIRIGAQRSEGLEILSGLAVGESILAEVPADFAGGTPIISEP